MHVDLAWVCRFHVLLGFVALSAAGCASTTAIAPADAGLATIVRFTPRVLVARPATEPIKIDGELSEADWQAARPAGEFTLELDSAMVSLYPTTVRALYDRENLYLSMVCDEPNTDRLVALAEERDGVYSSDDRVEMLVGPGEAGKRYYEFILTCGNVQADARCEASAKRETVYTAAGPVETLRGSHQADPRWDPNWRSATAKDAEQWTAELAIPFRAIGVDPKRQRLARINFARCRVTYEPSRRRRRRLNRKPEYSVWSPPKGDFHTPALFGFLALADATGKTPPVPEEMEAAVPGLPGMPGVPDDTKPPKQVRFTIHADRPGRPLIRFWDGLNASWMSPGFLARTYAKGYMRQIRCGSGWRRRQRPGRSRPASRPAWVPARAVDTFDAIRRYNILAIVTLRQRPGGIQYKSTHNARWGRVLGPPKNEEDYRLIYQAYRDYFQQLYDARGKEFFDSLRFEFWNEPDGSERFFAGTVEDYCKWYDWVAKALKDVSPTGKIGGPAVTGGGFDFAKAFLDHCREGENAATGGKGAPLDFITFHTYGWRWQLAPMASYDTIYTVVRFWHIIHDAGFAGTETHVTEWGIEPTGDASGPYFWFRKTHYAPVWMAKLVKDLDDARETYAHLQPRLDGLSLCMAGMRTRPPFAGRRTLFVDKWVPKPYYNGYVILNELGSERLQASGPDAGRVGCLPTRRADGSLAVLVFHFKEYAKTSPPDEDITVELARLPLEGRKISQMRVDHETSNSYAAWVELGSPDEITEQMAEELKAAAQVRKTPLEPQAGLIRLNMPVNSVAVVLVE